MKSARPPTRGGIEGDVKMLTTTAAGEALSKLRETRADLLCARLSASQAQVSLSGARAVRARELTDKIADAIGHVERLMFFVEGDGGC
jgi:hypothetical protein